MVSTVARLEVRVQQLQGEVRDLKTRLETVPQAPWYRQILGTLADDPAFDEVARLGQELRAAERKSPPKKAVRKAERRVAKCLSFLTPTISPCFNVRAHRAGGRAAVTRLAALRDGQTAVRIVEFEFAKGNYP